MNCNNTPKCEKPCGDCPEQWPVPAGSEVDASLFALQLVAAFDAADIAPTDTQLSVFEEGWRAALQSQQPAGWRAIETAPKDGRKMLLFYTNSNGLPRVVVGGWVTDEEAAETDADGVGLEAGWYERIDNWNDYYQVAIHEGEPTHWMPLPPAPSSASEPAQAWKRLTAEQIMHLQETHVGDPTPQIPLGTSDWICFARAIESAIAEANGVKLDADFNT